MRRFRPRGWMLIVAALVVIALIPQALSDFWLYTLSLVLVYGVVAVGYNLLVGNTGQISLAPAAFIAIGAYSVTIADQRGLGIALGVVIAIALSAAISLVLGAVTLRLSGFYLALGTLSLASLVQQLTGTQDQLTGGYGGTPSPAVILFESGYGPLVDNFYTIALVALVIVVVTHNLLSSYLGRALAAVRDVDVAASASGVHPRHYRLVAFVISGIYGAIGGCLYSGLLGYIDPSQFGLLLTIQLVGAIVIGGMGSIAGSLLGAAFFVILPQLLQVSSASQAVGFGIAIMVTIVVLPGGFVSLLDLAPKAPQAVRRLLGGGGVSSSSPLPADNPGPRP